jgi:hypothetical protein
VPGLSAADFTVTGAVKSGNLLQPDSTRPYYILPVTVLPAATSGTTITVQLNKAGYEFTPSSRSIQAHTATSYGLTANFTGLTANGSSIAATTGLTLTFDREITGLTAADITIYADGVTKGQTLTGAGTTWYLPVTLSNTVTDNTEIYVLINNIQGYAFSTSYRSVRVRNTAAAITQDNNTYSLTALTASGYYSNTTNWLTLTFDKPISLTVSDITVIGASKDSLSGSGTSYTLYISNITEHILTVIVAKPGYTFAQNALSVSVHKSS